MKKIIRRVKNYLLKLFLRFKNYIKRLFSPIYLFPLKLATYSAYYFVKFIIKLIIAIIGLVFDIIRYPFRSLKNFLKSILIGVVVLYLFASLFVITDYLTKQYGWWGKFLCSFGTRQKLQNSVVRIIGGYSEGSGFFVYDDAVVTNFHVIVDEPSPKIVFPSGEFVTPVKIIGNRDLDIAVLFTKEKYPGMVFEVDNRLFDDEPVIATGYALGTALGGAPTILKGNFVAYRKPKNNWASIQTDINLVPGMSGGPLTDQCGVVAGINTMGLSGLSLFIDALQTRDLVYTEYLNDTQITKINVDPSKSPEDAVIAFYTYLKARRMEDGFSLLSREYLQKTNFEEWTSRFTDILDVNVVKTEKYLNTKDIVFVKFTTQNWVDNDLQWHYYEGTWQTIPEDGVYKMLKSNIKEVEEPTPSWWYE